MTDISCGAVYEATLASLVLFRSYCYVSRNQILWSCRKVRFGDPSTRTSAFVMIGTRLFLDYSQSDDV